jgi:hypothetical protein
MVFYFWLGPQVLWNDLWGIVIKQRHCQTFWGIIHVNQVTPEDRKLPITELKWDARTVTDIPGNTAYWFFAFFWQTEYSRNKKTRHIYKAKTPAHGENIGKSSYLNLPDIDFTLFTPMKGRIDSLTVYIYIAETCTNILRYNTCMSSYSGDRKWTKIEP